MFVLLGGKNGASEKAPTELQPSLVMLTKDGELRWCSNNPAICPTLVMSSKCFSEKTLLKGMTVSRKRTIPGWFLTHTSASNPAARWGRRAERFQIYSRGGKLQINFSSSTFYLHTRGKTYRNISLSWNPFYAPCAHILMLPPGCRCPLLLSTTSGVITCYLPADRTSSWSDTRVSTGDNVRKHAGNAAGFVAGARRLFDWIFIVYWCAKSLWFMLLLYANTTHAMTFDFIDLL